MENTINVKKAAEFLGVTVKTMQRWEREKRLVPIGRTSSNRRVYTLSLKAGQSCCLQYSLSSNVAGNYILQPLVSSIPATYNAKAPSNVVTVNISDIFTITPSVGANGSITPSQPITVESGSSQTFTATPNTGYGVNQWLLDGGVVQTGGTSYTLSNITANHTVEVTFGTANLTATPSLTLSVTGLTTTTGNNSGTARFITITNNGSNIATNVNYTVSPALAANQGHISPASCGTIAANGGTCTLTVTPGGTPTAAVADSNPTPITVTISGDNTNAPTTTVNILTYGSFYQAGWLFSIIETASTSPSIGGTVAAETDNAAQNKKEYSPSAAGTTTAMYSGMDGAANTAAMVKHYNDTTTDYSAGVCIYPNYSAGGYRDWYLPAICQMGFGGSDTNFNCGTSPGMIPNIQYNLLVLNPTQSFGFVNSGSYWSSTASESIAPTDAWFQEFVVGGGGGFQFEFTVGGTLGVRCARAITN